MKNYYDKKDGYRETIQKGLTAARSFGRVVSGKKGTIEEQTEMLKNEIQKTYDNEQWVMEALKAQGFVKDIDGIFTVPDNREIAMEIPTNLIPKCPDDGSDVTMNLRADETFVEDEGWHKASEIYYNFLEENKNKHILFLELGVGANTPVIIKYPFWQMTMSNEKAVYACVN